MSQLANPTSARARFERFVGVLERADGLDSVADKISCAARPALLRSRRVHRLLSGTDLGHPMHPAAVLLPAGSWLSATIIDCLGGVEGRATARRLVGVGVCQEFWTGPRLLIMRRLLRSGSW
jgi:hypothetical protein